MKKWTPYDRFRSCLWTCCLTVGALLTTTTCGDLEPDNLTIVMGSDRVVYAEARTKAGHGAPPYADIIVTTLDSGLSTRITDDSFLDEFPIWSPDGKHIVFLSAREGSKGYLRYAGAGADRQIYVYDVASREFEKRTPKCEDGFSNWHFYREKINFWDDSSLVIIGGKNRLYRMEIRTGLCRLIKQFDDSIRIEYITCSPLEKSVLLIVNLRKESDPDGAPKSGLIWWKFGDSNFRLVLANQDWGISVDGFDIDKRHLYLMLPGPRYYGCDMSTGDLTEKQWPPEFLKLTPWIYRVLPDSDIVFLPGDGVNRDMMVFSQKTGESRRLTNTGLEKNTLDVFVQKQNIGKQSSP